MSQNPIKDLVSRYKDGMLERYEFIDKMQSFNKVLFYFSERLKEINIQRIEIQDGMLLFTTRREGIKLLFNGVDRRGVPFDILNFGSYEEEDEPVLFNLLSEESIIFDVGANIGWYSLLFSKKMPRSKVYSFEPITETYGYLVANIALNGATNLSHFNLGLSEKEQLSTFYYFPGGSVLASERNLINCSKATKRICQMESLDCFVSNHNIENIDLIKCDVEGGELSVIKGGINSIKKFLPILFIELFERWTLQFDYRPDDLIRTLRDIGYECFLAKGNHLEPCPVYRESEEERLNFFFLHSKKHQKLLKKYAIRERF